MSNLWPLPIFLGAAALLIVLYSFGARLVTGTRPFRQAFWCPFRNTNVRVDFAESAWDGRLVDVQGCTVFTPPTGVHCDKACLVLKRLPALRAETPATETRSWVW